MIKTLHYDSTYHQHQINQMRGDANCLFRAFSCFLSPSYSDQSRHYDIKMELLEFLRFEFQNNQFSLQELRNYIRNDRSLLNDIMRRLELDSIAHSLEDIIDYIGFDQYLEYMALPDVYGGEMELGIFCRKFNKRLLVFRNTDFTHPIYQIGDQTHEICILLYHDGIHTSGNHYDIFSREIMGETILETQPIATLEQDILASDDKTYPESEQGYDLYNQAAFYFIQKKKNILCLIPQNFMFNIIPMRNAIN